MQGSGSEQAFYSVLLQGWCTKYEDTATILQTLYGFLQSLRIPSGNTGEHP